MSGHRLVGFFGLALLGATPAFAQHAAATSPATAPLAAPVRSTVPRVLPGTREAAFITIKGNALDSDTKGLPHSLVRLRDASFGRIVDKQITDSTGLFAFRTVDPGPYVVELLGIAEKVLAASQLLNVGAGETVSVVVQLPIDVSDSASSVVRHGEARAGAVTAAAGDSGVLASRVTGVDASAR
jgi:hypothetical protein